MTRHRPAFWIVAVLLGALAGFAYNRLFGYAEWWAGSLVYGACISLVVTAYERGALLPRVRDWVRRLPTLAYVPLAELAYVLLIVAGHALAGVLVRLFGLTPDGTVEAIIPPPRVLAYSLAVSVVFVFVLRVRDLIGGEAFLSLITGRYRRPVREERIFLFADLAGSTAYAARHGDLRTQAYLSAIFTALADPVQRHRGAIDDYIGDMALITWPLARGVEGGRCVACAFAILDRIEAEAPHWQARFGEVPRLRLALHGGTVVTAEVGVDRHKIAYFGDTVNTTARLEGLCRTLGAAVLISGDLLDRLPHLPDGIAARALGPHALRGREQPLPVAALDRTNAAAPAVPLRRRAARAG